MADERKVEVDSFRNCRGDWKIRLDGTYKNDTILTLRQAELLVQDLQETIRRIEDGGEE